MLELYFHKLKRYRRHALEKGDVQQLAFLSRSTSALNKSINLNTHYSVLCREYALLPPNQYWTFTNRPLFSQCLCAIVYLQLKLLLNVLTLVCNAREGIKKTVATTYIVCCRTQDTWQV